MRLSCKGRVQSWYTGEQVRQASVSSLLADDAKGQARVRVRGRATPHQHKSSAIDQKNIKK
eukprot:1852735-Amphidinium_carterae.1